MSVSNKNRTSLLVITHINFWERDLGSRMRLLHMLDYLKKYFLITVAYTAVRQMHDLNKLEEIGYREMVVFLDELEESEIDEDEIEKLLKIHTILNHFYDKSLYKKMQTHINEHSYDNVMIEYIHFSYFLPLLKDQKIFLDSIDILNIRNKLFKKNNQKHWIDISEKEELTLFAEYNRVIAIQQSDYKYLIDHNINSVLAPYSVFIGDKEFRNGMRNLVFIGGDTAANIEAINWFISEIWPVFLCSGLQLLIGGSVSEVIGKEEKIFDKKRIILMGKIDDLDSFYRNKADIIINPVHIGGGLKIKNVEALAYGLPLITTSEGSNGLEEAINSAFLLADSSEEWIEALIALDLSADLRKSLSENAYHFAQKYFSEEACYNELVQLMAADNRSINSLNIEKKSSRFIHKEAAGNVKETIDLLHQSIEEVKRQISQYQHDVLVRELCSYVKIMDRLAGIKASKHPFEKISEYRMLIDSYKKNRYFSYSDVFKLDNQHLIYEFRQNIEKLNKIGSIKHPLQKLKIYKEILEWYNNIREQPKWVICF